MTIFEKFLLWLYRNKREFTITTGCVYGHKIYKLGRYTVTEISANEVIIDADDFYYKATSIEDLLDIVQAIR